ncbi:hypothetical protein RRG08_026577 [Elysia crispata]|uniref:Uncharacterized protein n=1 Tax=Elysia crispata TaxID=231223 RepID=A0AAE1CS49_9GAST|nr:hypothetical protein RRG08_026577 [Elysia crispata]
MEEKSRNIKLVPDYQDKNGEFFKDSDYYKRNLLPVDRGWAWVISFGLGAGMVIVPGISLIRYYFHRRRSLAQIIGRCGISVCGIVMPTLIRLIRKEFGVRDTFLVVAAIELHIVLAGLLLRPVESYKFKPELPPLKPKRKRKEKTVEQEIFKDPGKQISDLAKISHECDNHLSNNISRVCLNGI